MENQPWPQTRRCGKLVLVAGCSLLLTTTRAQAHTTFPGLGEFASGFLHPFTTPAHLMILLALGLWVGQHPPLRLKSPAAAFGAAAALGLGLTVAMHIGAVYPPLLVVVGLCIGACVAAGIPLPLWVKVAACVVAAFLLGLDSGADAGTPVASLLKILPATWVSLVLCLVNVAFYVSLLPTMRWAQIGVRILGSWIVAIALLLLAFALRR